MQRTWFLQKLIDRAGWTGKCSYDLPNDHRPFISLQRIEKSCGLRTMHQRSIYNPYHSLKPSAGLVACGRIPLLVSCRGESVTVISVNLNDLFANLKRGAGTGNSPKAAPATKSLRKVMKMISIFQLISARGHSVVANPKLSLWICVPDFNFPFGGISKECHTWEDHLKEITVERD